jgi:hypothetical protein
MRLLVRPVALWHFELAPAWLYGPFTIHLLIGNVDDPESLDPVLYTFPFKLGTTENTIGSCPVSGPDWSGCIALPNPRYQKSNWTSNMSCDRVSRDCRPDTRSHTRVVETRLTNSKIKHKVPTQIRSARALRLHLGHLCLEYKCATVGTFTSTHLLLS